MSRKGLGTEEISLVKILDLFRRRWYIIVITFLLSLLICKLYLRYSHSIYMAQTTLRIEEGNSLDKSIGLLSGLGMYRDDIQSEMQLIKSRTLITEALDEMDINTLYYVTGTFKTTELYKKECPFEVYYDTSSTLRYNQNVALTFTDENSFELYDPEIESIPHVNGKVGEPVPFLDMIMVIKHNPKATQGLKIGKMYMIKPVKTEHLLGRANKGLQIEQGGYLVPILKLTFEDEVAQFSSDFLNTLVKVYQNQDINRKRQAANQAISFIEEQVDTLISGVNIIGDIIKQYQKSNEFVSTELKTQMDGDDYFKYHQIAQEKQMLIHDLDRLEDELFNNKSHEAISFSLGSQTDKTLVELVGKYNRISDERDKDLQQYTEKHPKIIDYNNQLNILQSEINNSILSIRKAVNRDLKFAVEKRSTSLNKLMVIPEIERGMENLKREYVVKEKILETLLEKQAEAQIAKASIVSSVLLMDEALRPVFPVSPIPQKIYVIGCGLGFSMGFLIVLLMGVMKTTISFKEEIESASVTPIIGVVRRSQVSLNSKHPKLLIASNPKSQLSESIRSIRTNLEFIGKEGKSKIVATTSTISGEGKSFISINLAGMISLLNKKVIIVDMDMRKPKLHFSFAEENSEGLSTYLSGMNSLEEVIRSTEYNNLDIITSGPIPPNPAELIQGPRMKEMLDKLSQNYEYILVDLPPIGLVTDGHTILKMADVSLYVIRAEYSKKVFLKNPDQLVEDHGIKNLYIIFNSVSSASRRYGSYGYGYMAYGSGYYSEDEAIEYPWWYFWKKIKRR